MQYMRAQLDALMGVDRNGDMPGGPNHFSDPDVCKYYIAGLCPHELFANTKMDLGECTKMHSFKMKSEYENCEDKEKYGFDVQLYGFIERIISDVDRKVAMGQRRAAEREGDIPDSSGVELQAKLDGLDREIVSLMAQAEKLGTEGNVEKSSELFAQAERLTAARQQLQGSKPREDGRVHQQKLRVCQVCAAFLSLYDSERRLADHFGGKQHLGLKKLREMLAEWKEKRETMRAEGRLRDRTEREAEFESGRDREGDRPRKLPHTERVGRDERDYGRSRNEGDRGGARRSDYRGNDGRVLREDRDRDRDRRGYRDARDRGRDGNDYRDARDRGRSRRQDYHDDRGRDVDRRRDHRE